MSLASSLDGVIVWLDIEVGREGRQQSPFPLYIVISFFLSFFLAFPSARRFPDSPHKFLNITDRQPTMRKTRFVCVSDTHNASPNGAFKLPKGDVLIHAGDMTNQGSISELRKTVKWLEEADFETKIVVAGMFLADITIWNSY